MRSYFPELLEQVPHRHSSAWSRALFQRLFLAQGWRFVGFFPNIPKAVAIISPHTSNFDAWYGFNALLGLGLKITILGKQSLFHTPLKPLLHWIGVIPVNRTYPHGLTQDIVHRIHHSEKIWIGLAPEGTRKQAKSIRSGFYRIAYGAQIPIVMFSFDYAQKIIHCLGVFHPTGHFEQDLEHILDLYIGKFSAKNPKWLAKPLQKRLKNS